MDKMNIVDAVREEFDDLRVEIRTLEEGRDKQLKTIVQLMEDLGILNDKIRTLEAQKLVALEEQAVTVERKLYFERLSNSRHAKLKEWKTAHEYMVNRNSKLAVNAERYEKLRYYDEEYSPDSFDKYVDSLAAPCHQLKP